MFSDGHEESRVPTRSAGSVALAAGVIVMRRHAVLRPAAKRLTIVVTGAAIWLASATQPAPAADLDEEIELEESSDEEDFLDLSLEELNELPVDIVHAASRYRQTSHEAPSSVTVLTADDIRKSGHRHLHDVLRSIRGLYVTYDRNYYYLGARGFGLPADYNTRVLLLVDGHRTNDSVLGSALIGTEFSVDVDLIERIEFVRGPSSSLYGDGAFFGVLSIFTKKGSAIDGPQVSAEVASFGTYKGRLSYGKEFENGIELLLSASMLDSAGQTLGFREFDDPLTNNGLAEDVDGETYYNLFSRLAYSGLALQAVYSFREKDVPTASYDTIFNSRHAKTIDQRLFVDVRYERQLDCEVDVLTRLFYDFYRYQGDYPLEDEGPPTTTILNQDDAIGAFWGAEVLASKTFWDRAKVTVGAEYRDYFRQDQSSVDRMPHAVYLDDEQDTEIIAAFAQGEVLVYDGLHLNAGLRVDHYESFGEALSPRVGLMYNPWESTSFKLLYGRAFRAPTAFEMHYHDGFDTAKPNPTLDPETIDTYEVVYEQQILKDYRIAVTAFHYDIDDLILQIEDPSDGLAVYRNSDRVESNGAEFELRAKLPWGLRAWTSYAYQRTKNKDTGTVLTNSPQHLLKLNVVAPLFEDKLFASLELQYMSERWTLAGGRAEDFFVANLTLFAEELVDGLELSASVYNLFDTKYDDPGAVEHQQDLIEQDGLSFRFQVTYTF